MAIKKFFIDNETYGVDAMNAIVAGLRTTGVDGEITNSLRVSKNGSLTVNIAPGRGWVDGCQIELTATETRAVSSAAGTYSVIMQLSKTDTQTNDIDIAVVSGSVTGAHVLAHVTVSGSAITTVTDVRTYSRAIGNTTIPVSIRSGKAQITGTIAAGKTMTKVIPVPSGAVKVCGFIYSESTLNEETVKDYASSAGFIGFSVGQGLNYLHGHSPTWSNYNTFYFPWIQFGTRQEYRTKTGLFIASMELTAAGLTIVYENTDSSAISIDKTIAWEAWNYDTV